MGQESRNPLTIIEAARAADCSTETVRLWCSRLEIGERTADGWRVDPDKLAKVIEARAILQRGAA
jgi:hypothetical protein